MTVTEKKRKKKPHWKSFPSLLIDRNDKTVHNCFCWTCNIPVNDTVLKLMRLSVTANAPTSVDLFSTWENNRIWEGYPVSSTHCFLCVVERKETKVPNPNNKQFQSFKSWKNVRIKIFSRSIVHQNRRFTIKRCLESRVNEKRDYQRQNLGHLYRSCWLHQIPS